MTNKPTENAFDQVAQILGPSVFNHTISTLESRLAGAPRANAAASVADAAFTPELLAAAFDIRRRVGRLNDLIHAAAISLSLEHILEDNEQILDRPSLAAGNDSVTQQFDLHTDRRVAEYKLSEWKGGDSQRQRGLFSDLVHLAANMPAGKRAQLFVVGNRPTMWLRTTKATTDWALNGASKATIADYKALGGTSSLPVPKFFAGLDPAVEVVNLEAVIPGLDQMLAGTWNQVEKEHS